MTLNIPSTSLRSKYLKTLPVGTVYKDPKSGYNYKVTEKKLNNTLIKVAVAYLGSDIEPISLQDVTEEYLKIEHPQKANIMKLMKNRLIALQKENKVLLEQQQKSLYQRIKDHLNEQNYYETKDVFYCLHSGMVLPLKKKLYPSIEEAMAILDESVDKIFKDSKVLLKTMSKQHSIQTKLFQLLINKTEAETKEILL
jgi:hypothetical protein